MPVYQSPLDQAFDDLARRAADRVGLLPEDYYRLPARLRSEAFTASGLASLDQINQLKQSLAQAIANGSTLRQWREGLSDDFLKLGNARLETIFRNSVQTAYGNGRTDAQRENKANRPFLMWDAVNDSRTRPSHRAMDGFIAPIDDPIWNVWAPPAGHRCLLPGTRVRGNFRIGLKSFYSGPAVEIITRSGTNLSVTGNHPILTRNGWVAAKDVKCGDDLLCDRSVINSALLHVVNNQDAPSKVEEIFDALAAQALGCTHTNPLDFHGDAQFGEGKVDVAGADGVLMVGYKPCIAHGSSKRHFIFADYWRLITKRIHARCSSVFFVKSPAVFADNPFGVSSGCSSSFSNQSNANISSTVKTDNGSLQSIVNSSGNTPSSGALALNSRPVAFHFRPFERFSLRLASWLNSVSPKKPVYGLPTSAKIFRNLINTKTRCVFLKNKIRRFGLPLNIRLANTSTQNIGILLRSSINSSISQQTVEKAITDTILFKQLSDRGAGEIFIDDVISIRNFTFSGHVFDFETDQGWMIADGIIVSNCRCSRIALNESQAIKRGYVPGNQPPADARPDPGWDYDKSDKGARESLLKQLAEKKLEKLPTVVRDQADILLQAAKSNRVSPVSEAFDLPKSPKYDPAREALSLIDLSHDDGLLESIKLAMKRMKAGAFGSYDPVKRIIEISTGLSFSEAVFAALHEIGHALDHLMIGAAGRLESMRPGGRLQKIIDAAKDTPEFAYWSILDSEIKEAYWTTNEEIFARVYSQWVATLHGVPIPEKLQEFHWSEASFAPIMLEIEAYFAQEGLL